jgi:hypothetical protein
MKGASMTGYNLMRGLKAIGRPPKALSKGDATNKKSPKEGLFLNRMIRV